MKAQSGKSGVGTGGRRRNTVGNVRNQAGQRMGRRDGAIATTADDYERLWKRNPSVPAIALPSNARKAGAEGPKKSSPVKKAAAKKTTPKKKGR